jgi:hypothetical protein
MSLAGFVPLGGQQAPSACDAGSATLRESVLDLTTRVALRGATVTVTWREAGGERRLTARTDSAGRAFFCLPDRLEVVIRASYRDVDAVQSRTVVVASNPAHMTSIDAPYVYLRGQVLDHATEAPIANAAVALSNTGLGVLTDTEGRFVFPRVPAGDYDLRIEHPAYAATRTPLNLRTDDLQATFRVTPQAIPLAPVVVTAFSRRLEGVGFYERERRGVGSFIGRQQITDARPQFASDLLRSVPGVRLVTTAARRGAPRSFTTGRGNCRFRFVVDGARVLPDFELDNIAPLYIEGIEVYAGLAEVPSVFRAQSADGVASTCGVIAVWTKDGR